MNIQRNKIKFLHKARSDFVKLSTKSKYKAITFRIIDFLAKIIMSVGGALITYFSESKDEIDSNFKLIRAIGIIITVITAFSSVFTFEKRSQSHIQIYIKCKSIIPEIDDKIENNDVENVKEYVKSIYKELSILSIASFTDSFSSRNLKNMDKD